MAMKRYPVAGRMKVPRSNGHMFTPIENFRDKRFDRALGNLRMPACLPHKAIGLAT